MSLLAKVGVEANQVLMEEYGRERMLVSDCAPPLDLALSFEKSRTVVRLNVGNFRWLVGGGCFVSIRPPTPHSHS